MCLACVNISKTVGDTSKVTINPFTAGTHYTGFRAKFGRAPEPSLLEITNLLTAGAQ